MHIGAQTHHLWSEVERLEMGGVVIDHHKCSNTMDYVLKFNNPNQAAGLNLRKKYKYNKNRLLSVAAAVKFAARSQRLGVSDLVSGK